MGCLKLPIIYSSVRISVFYIAIALLTLVWFIEITNDYDFIVCVCNERKESEAPSLQLN